MSGYIISKEKMVEFFANWGGPDQTPRSAASDMGLHCLPATRLQLVKLVKKTLNTFKADNSVKIAFCYLLKMCLLFFSEPVLSP